MEDILIFSFGLAVTIVVGSGLATMISVKNRILYDKESADSESGARNTARSEQR